MSTKENVAKATQKSTIASAVATEKKCRQEVRSSKSKHMKAYAQKKTMKPTTQKVADVLECLITDPRFYDLSSVHSITIKKKKIYLPTFNVEQFVKFFDFHMGTNTHEAIFRDDCPTYLQFENSEGKKIFYSIFTQIFNFTCDPISGKFIQSRLYDRLNPTTKGNSIRDKSGYFVIFDDYARTMLGDNKTWADIPMIVVSDSNKSTLRKYQ